MSRADSELIVATSDHLASLCDWFANPDEARQWSGQELPWPLSAGVLQNCIASPSHLSRALMRQRQFIGFAQVVERLGCHHLCRVVVHPKQRRKGVGEVLLKAVMLDVQSRVPDSQFSLFVYQQNSAAIALYQKLGFTQTAYPYQERNNANQHLPRGCVYMTRQCE